MFPANTRILIVDDMMTMRKIVAKVCKELGYTDLVEAADGMNAWRELTTSSVPFGLVISDWNMPNLSGLDLVRKVRSEAKYKDLPFLMVTAEVEVHQVKEAIASGVDNYVVKPFTADGLKEKLAAVYAKRSKKAA